MAKQGGSLPRGRRRRDEVPPVPDSARLTPTQRRAQSALRDMVEKVGGRFDDHRTIPVEQLTLLGELFDEWAETHGDRTGDGIRFSGRPGLWHALDVLCPLQDPNRWDALRAAVIGELELKRWRRVSPPRGSAFEITFEGSCSTNEPLAGGFRSPR